MASNTGPTLSQLLSAERLRGDALSHRVRWAFMGLSLILAVVMLLSGRYPRAAWTGLGLLVMVAGYNGLLGFHLRRQLVPLWVRYLTTSGDIALVTLYNHMLSVHFAPIGVATSAVLLVYPIILFFVALRMDKWQLAYSIAFTLLCINLAYFANYHRMDPTLLAQVVSADRTGQVFKSIFLLGLGLGLFSVHSIVRRLLANQAKLFQEHIAAEEHHRATLESQVQERTRELRQTNEELRQALTEVKALSGLLPMCSHCKKIRDDQGYWQAVEKYLVTHSQARFSHGLCPDCLKEHYPEFSDIVLEETSARHKKSEES